MAIVSRSPKPLFVEVVWCLIVGDVDNRTHAPWLHAADRSFTLGKGSSSQPLHLYVKTTIVDHREAQSMVELGSTIVADHVKP